MAVFSCSSNSFQPRQQVSHLVNIDMPYLKIRLNISKPVIYLSHYISKNILLLLVKKTITFLEAHIVSSDLQA